MPIEPLEPQVDTPAKVVIRGFYTPPGGTPEPFEFVTVVNPKEQPNGDS